MNYLKFGLIAILVASSSAKAELVSIITVDMNDKLDISWNWDGSSPSVSKPVFSNWGRDVALTIDLSTSSSGIIGHLDIDDPADPFAILAPLLILGDSNAYGTLVDDKFNFLNVDYHFIFERDINPSNSVIQLTATVVPVPSPFLMYLSATLALFLKSKKCKSEICGSKAILAF